MDRQANTQATPHSSAIVDEAHPIGCGPLSALIADGAIRSIAYRGVEIVRGVDCPIRDANWGTAVQEGVDERIEEFDGGVAYQRRFSVFGGALEARLDAQFRPSSLRLDLSLTAKQTVETNRAGFTLLHPLDGVAGADLVIVHADGTEETTEFPLLIMPSQPAFDIAGLRHTVHGVDVDIAFAGEVFEMEDQRNWTDASFKTYCRPLRLPFPYPIEAGSTVTQSIEIKASGTVGRARPDAVASEVSASLPDVALAGTPAWSARADEALIAHLPHAARLIRLDVGADDPAGAIHDIVALGGPFEFELVLDDDGGRDAVLADLAGHMHSSGVKVASVVALPRAYLRSYQPSGPWPAGRTIDEAMNAAAAVWPEVRAGLGMLTNFTEFNRHPPPTGLGDFVTYSTTAIVHAADDRSVFETLQALPYVHRCARALAGERELRLGLASIGMRSNPYGAAVADNPGLDRLAMAMDDPRQRTVFGAAFAVGAYAIAADCGVARIGLAGIGGPFATGAVESGGFTAWPIHHVVKALASLSAGQRVANPALPAPVLGVQSVLEGQCRGVFANCGLEPVRVSLPGQSVIVMAADDDVTDPDWLARAEPGAADAITLEPASVVFTDGGAA